MATARRLHARELDWSAGFRARISGPDWAGQRIYFNGVSAGSGRPALAPTPAARGQPRTGGAKEPRDRARKPAQFFIIIGRFFMSQSALGAHFSLPVVLWPFMLFGPTKAVNFHLMNGFGLLFRKRPEWVRHVPGQDR